MMELEIKSESEYMLTDGLCDEVILTIDCYIDGSDYDDPVCGELVSVFNVTKNMDVTLEDLHPLDLKKFEDEAQDAADSRAEEIHQSRNEAASDAAYERGREEGW